MKRIAELERICGELYQVIGSLAGHAGCFDDPEVQRALDNAAKAKLVHRNLLPWPRRALSRTIPNAETNWPVAPSYTIEGLCEGITPENRHAEVDWGRDVGEEIID